MKALRKNGSIIILSALILLLIQGCCEPDEYKQRSKVFENLTRYELATFIDSAGDHLQLLLNEEGFTPVHDGYSDCDRYDHFPWAEFIFLPPAQGVVTYSQYYHSIRFPDFAVGAIAGGNIDTVIQGHSYANCGISAQTDSIGEVYSVIIDAEYGIVMFSLRDQYRWERVLE